jgi:hypothetical protein
LLSTDNTTNNCSIARILGDDKLYQQQKKKKKKQNKKLVLVVAEYQLPDKPAAGFTSTTVSDAENSRKISYYW